MTTQSEQQLENALITQLETLGWDPVSIKDEPDLVSNLKRQLEGLSGGELSLDKLPFDMKQLENMNIPGMGFVNRTLGDESMDLIIGNVKSYIPEEQIKPVYNVYLVSLYNTLSYKNITWYVEGAYKSPEASPAIT